MSSISTSLRPGWRVAIHTPASSSAAADRPSAGDATISAAAETSVSNASTGNAIGLAPSRSPIGKRHSARERRPWNSSSARSAQSIRSSSPSACVVTISADAAPRGSCISACDHSSVYGTLANSA